MGTLEIKTSFFPLALPQALVFPVIEIDGTPYRKYWGTHSFHVPPGRHTVKAYHRWFFFRQCHLSEITVEVPENQTVRLRWATPIMVMSPGKWSRA